MAKISILKRFYPPEVKDMSALELERKEIAENIFVCSDSWLKKNKYGLWEMYLEGSPFDIGAKNGILTKELAEFQEEAFIEQIRQMVPSESYLRFLKYFIGWFNRNMALHVPMEYQKEIFGISRNASNEYNYISKPYHRILNYHAAHDIGHALQNMNMVYCTAFGVKNQRSSDNNMIIGRNFDLYIGDGFAENKIVTFFNPENGYKLSTITWGGMIGAVSGMNEKGLTITYNSAKSDIPKSAKIPVSILARKILQYAATIDEAYEIAKSHETFVSGSFFIASAEENRMVVIEKTKRKIDLFETGTNDLILTNHYQGEKLKNRDLNIQNIEESSSMYRWERTQELLEKQETHDIHSFAEILRDQKGKNNRDIGMGNEKAVNQLIAHHSIIFKPQELKFWVSSNPFQLGSYVAYDLNKVFSDSIDIEGDIYIEDLNIPEDDFLHSEEYQNFLVYKEKSKQFEKQLKQKKHNIEEQEILEFLKLNPEFYNTWLIAGDYYKSTGNMAEAIKHYQTALSKEIPWKSEEEKIMKSLKKIKK
ncbi:MAG: C45 family autoproteolytic acyltransferase/hydrolase [Bacteroidota bacterium]